MGVYQILFWALFGLTLLIFIVNTIFSPLIRKKMASKAELEQNRATAKIKVGDKIMLVSGVLGLVKKIHKRNFEIEVAPNVVIRVDKQGIMGYFDPKNKKQKKSITMSK